MALPLILRSERQRLALPSLCLSLLYLSIEVLVVRLTGLRLPIALHIALVLRVGGAITLAALATLALAGLILIGALAGALVLALFLVLASLLGSRVGVLVLLFTHDEAPVEAGNEGTRRRPPADAVAANGQK